jgi:hypothetical protein
MDMSKFLSSLYITVFWDIGVARILSKSGSNFFAIDFINDWLNFGTLRVSECSSDFTDDHQPDQTGSPDG